MCVCVCMCACVCACTITQSCLTHCNPMDCSPPGSPVRGILQARVLERVPFSTSKDLSDLGIELVFLVFPLLAGRFFTTEPPGKHFYFIRENGSGVNIHICRRDRGRTRCKISVSFLGKDHRWPGLNIKSVCIMHCSSWYSVKVMWF